MTILVVGGAGYIGSHVCKELKAKGFAPVVFDNFSNGHKEAVKWGELVEGDLLNLIQLDRLFLEKKPVAVVHLASLIDCRESMEEPGKYWLTNLMGTLKLLEMMVKYGVRNLVFSSTAAVYGIPKHVPIVEDHPFAPVNVYGETKLAAEKMIASFLPIKSVILRYFNAAGADSSGVIGENHRKETHLIPLAILAGLKKMPPLQIYGTDFETRDGTAIRDYVHVTDLAKAHVKALQWLLDGKESLVVNLGSGQGSTVKEVIAKVEEKLGGQVPKVVGERKKGDPPVLVADIRKAKETLGWKPESDLDTIVTSAVRWHSKL
jgi:UDP-glucose-4-epimerase GalE